ncbi:MAG: alpha-ketoacid dehydrogenase subunit beta, partial [Clostridia bacterium]|nr:alpha-ketoacid dehydrogenase subunit beta [Clostridia bacterium]MBN2882481.1 alpha-ketoacid dehydrogenase subunit beta [Clostridia bacterium]
MSVINVRQALNDAIREEMERDESVIIMGCDVALRGGPFGVTLGLLDQ